MVETTNNTFQFELVSPAKKLLDTQAYQVTVPGQEGDLGVRKGHASFVVTVRAGVVELLKTADATPERVFVAGGFADISADNCTILAEEAVPVEDLSAEALTAEIEALNEKLNIEDNDVEKVRLQNAIVITQEKLNACA